MCRYAPLCVLMVLTLAFSNFSRAESVSTRSYEQFVPIPHVVLKGETLSKIADNFDVPMRRILSPRFNVVLAKRNNPNRIYAGETVMIPLPVPATANSSASRDMKDSPALVEAVVEPAPAVAAPMIVKPLVDVSKKIAAMDESKTLVVENASAPASTSMTQKVMRTGLFPPGTLMLLDKNDMYLFFVLVAIALGCAWLAEFIRLYQTCVEESSRNKDPGNMTPMEIINLIDQVKVRTFVKVMGMTAIIDERKNSVRFKNIPEFMEHAHRRHHAHLWDCRIKDLGQKLTGTASLEASMAKTGGLRMAATAA